MINCVCVKRSGSFIFVSIVCTKRSDLFIFILLHNMSQILDFHQFHDQYFYYTCLCEMFEVNYLRRKYNKRSAAPLTPSIVPKISIKSCFDGFVFSRSSYNITFLCLFLCFVCFSGFASFILKYKTFCKLRARKIHFPKYFELRKLLPEIEESSVS